MGGKVLEYEAKTILNRGREEGLRLGKEEGREEGREEGIRGMVSILKDMNVPVQTILEKLQEEFNMSLETAKKYI